MILILLQGLIFGIAYVAPIGAQNLFVINSSINNCYKQILKIIWIVIFFDITLALACFIGIGIIFEFIPFLKIILLCIGCIVITYMGIRLIVKREQMTIEHKEQLNIKQIIVSSFVVTWLNPQAIIDGTILFGGFRSTLPENTAYIFIIGVCFASIIWFNSIAIITHKIMDKFKNFIKYINIICGVVLVFFGIKLGYSFIMILLNKN
jgi:L-lysine exporter family protein LysE/ArgO